MEHYQPPPSSSLFQLNLDATNGYTLRSAGSWAKVMAVVGLIMAIIFIGIGIMVQSAISKYGGSRYYRDQDLGGNTEMMANVGMIVYIAFGLLFLISSIFALNFGNRISRALKTNDQASLNSGFAGLRNFFAFWAILLIICLLLLLIGFAGLVAGSGN